jgi:hypothetical protein
MQRSLIVVTLVLVMVWRWRDAIPRGRGASSGNSLQDYEQASARATL